MKETTRPIFNKLIFSGIILIIILLMQPLEVYILLKDIVVLFPKGWIGLEQRNLLLLIQALMLLFIIPIYIMTFIFSWWYRADNDQSEYDPDLIDHKVAEIVWWGLPLIMTVLICIITAYKTYELDPYKPIASDKKAIEIEAVALQWRWLFIYPEEKIATVNYIQFPKETPIHFKITADAPMNAFWIPRLGGMIYAMPGMTTELNLIADEAGEFRGSSANISGKGFADMTFVAKASTQEEYEEWVASVKKSDQPMNIPVYRELAKPSEDTSVKLYQLEENHLFHEIVMKFMKPQSKI
ncbi:COX aromatic rich motif-containing protein [Waddlia chondrophila]|uniref:Ubiquinol oxidase polypeptide II n=1 Tax=Waddlia chondrophila (strain ATCC VR-1470 / WSU 86-1044) TaxID=716544 RepID=D6YUP9_WADCW|nr:COX aromatic rich motif-containing protein [Waddlia chondrophila]ADI37860.1 cytochrome o ubiquinol oxidase, subunit II [Waddlia chondrophila WSU 86-1044]